MKLPLSDEVGNFCGLTEGSYSQEEDPETPNKVDDAFMLLSTIIAMLDMNALGELVFASTPEKFDCKLDVFSIMPGELVVCGLSILGGVDSSSRGRSCADHGTMSS